MIPFLVFSIYVLKLSSFNLKAVHLLGDVKSTLGRPENTSDET